MRAPTTHVGGRGGGNAKLAKSLGTAAAVLEWVSKPLKVL